MAQGIELLKKWLPPITTDDKLLIVDFLTGVETGFGTPMLRKYIELLRPYTKLLGISGGVNRARESDCLASGIVFFYGCMCYIMHFPEWGTHIYDIFLYNLLYILVDHYIDDTTIDTVTKTTSIAAMWGVLINADYKMPLQDEVLDVITRTYRELLQRCPQVQKPLIDLFRAEIHGMHVQHNSSLSRQEYHDMACIKGGLTMVVLNAIVGNTEADIHDAAYHIGTIMQLIDDSVDVFSDKANSIHTIATHDLAVQGNLDTLWSDITVRIHNIDKRFNLFKFLYSVFNVYVPDRLHEAFSQELRTMTNEVNMFDFTYGCDGSALLTNAVMNEMLALEIIDDITHEEISTDS